MGVSTPMSKIAFHKIICLLLRNRESTAVSVKLALIPASCTAQYVLAFIITEAF
jgi:hypothetical protein